MTDLCERSLTDRREVLAKHKPVYFPFDEYLFCWWIILFWTKKTQNIQIFFSFKTSFQLP